MRKTSVCIMTLALLLCSVALMAAPASSSAPAATGSMSTGSTTDTTTTKTTTKTHKATCKAGHGEVSAKDDTAKTITVHPKTGADMTFTTNDKTSYWMGKKKATWADVATGQNAMISCSMDGANMVAKSVKLSAPKAAAAAKKTGA